MPQSKSFLATTVIRCPHFGKCNVTLRYSPNTVLISSSKKLSHSKRLYHPKSLAATARSTSFPNICHFIESKNSDVEKCTASNKLNDIISIVSELRLFCLFNEITFSKSPL